MLDYAQVLITPRCTLRCEKCSVASNLWDKNDKSEDMSIEDFKATVEHAFSRFRMMNELHIIGGEPLLNDKLPDMLEWLHDSFGAYINQVIIVTNATILPSGRLTNALRETRFTLLLSDYTREIPELTNRFNQVIGLAKENHIPYGVTFHPFVDYGYDLEEHGSSFRSCAQKSPYLCHEIRGDRIFYCTQARINNEIRGYGYKEDGISLATSTDEELESYIHGALFGHETCKRCRGADAIKYSCPMGRQMEEKEMIL